LRVGAGLATARDIPHDCAEWLAEGARHGPVQDGCVLRGGRGGADLLALRALANQPLRRLAKIDPDPVAAWRRGDATAVDALARLELGRLGLRR